MLHIYLKRWEKIAQKQTFKMLLERDQQLVFFFLFFALHFFAADVYSVSYSTNTQKTSQGNYVDSSHNLCINSIFLRQQTEDEEKYMKDYIYTERGFLSSYLKHST